VEAELQVLQPEQTRLGAEEEARVLGLMEQMGLPADRRAVHLDDFGWEANLVPRACRNVLVVGCGDGIELVFLRAVLPQARITAIDYHNSLLPGVTDVAQPEFHGGDVQKILPTLEREYDLIFSNHTMEHLYAPDAMLRTLAGLLVDGGHIVSTMPMVSVEGMPFLEEVRRYLDRRSREPEAEIHPLEVVYFDAGHPWKTNPGDIAATLGRAGFVEVRLYQREGHRSRPLQMDEREYAERRRQSVGWNRKVLGMARRLAMRLFPRKVPEKLPKLFFAVENRVPFGTNYVMNQYSEEALFLARVDR
jgi:SAM-dependent methyltransferase